MLSLEKTSLRREHKITSLEVRAAAWRDSGRALFSIFLWRGGGGGGNPIIWAQKHYASDKLYRYVLPHRVGSGRVHFAHFGLESRMVFEGTTGVYESIWSFQFQKEREGEICEFEMNLKHFFVCALI